MVFFKKNKIIPVYFFCLKCRVVLPGTTLLYRIKDDKEDDDDDDDDEKEEEEEDKPGKNAIFLFFCGKSRDFFKIQAPAGAGPPPGPARAGARRREALERGRRTRKRRRRKRKRKTSLLPRRRRPELPLEVSLG